MTDLRKAAEKALEALRNAEVVHMEQLNAMYALQEALDLQTAIEKGTKAWADVSADWVEELRGNDTPEVTSEVNEPEGWVKIDEVRHFLDSVGCGTIYKTAGEDRVPLYSAPQREWVGLRGQEIQAERHKLELTAGWTYDHFARAIEAKLKGKNTAPYTKNDITAGVLHKEWVGLTANEVYECWKSVDVVAAVEAKLKEKNT